MAVKMAAVKHYNWLNLSILHFAYARFYAGLSYMYTRRYVIHIRRAERLSETNRLKIVQNDFNKNY